MNQQEKDKIVRKLIDTNTTISTMGESHFRVDRIHDHGYGRGIGSFSGRLCHLSEQNENLMRC